LLDPTDNAKSSVDCGRPALPGFGTGRDPAPLSISAPRRQPWGRFATFADPDGNGFVLQQSQQ